MNILALDTSSKTIGLAVMTEEAVLYEIHLNTGKDHSSVLLPELDRALQSLAWELEAIDLFVVTTGPGSFTGIRIGLSTMKGFVLCHDKPLIGVSVLEALAHNVCGEDMLICPVLNGPMGDIYTALYRYRADSGFSCLLPDQIMKLQSLPSHVQEPVLLVGEGARAKQDELARLLPGKARFAPRSFHICRPSVVGQIGWEIFQKTGSHNPLSIIPAYLRPSEAELNSRG
ncbi:MAG: tRNA (adenosine(37)-N6)-threonylcarbamoyltransferase complex dimerization subunit type 1 TsaB [Syntrophobacterales bacterium]|jgi:tRNA threonylcarbamoyladenosine biosynthesis protein TsaB|nr:tRNA (adenosine(37)-N6)-threonylcarbamoyltransferase complex dimerization subunit type 1 TsaB [Syntrophobacterales bacterium]